MKKILGALGAVVILILIVILIRTFTFASRQVIVAPVTGISVDNETVEAHLCQAITYRTISHQDSASFDPQPFQALNRLLEETYPAVHQTLTKEVVSDYSLLYTWEGSDPFLEPIILLAHSDVVPVDPETVKDWAQPPYSGAIEGGYIWGRGAIDDKASLIGIMEAVEHLINDNFQPRKTIYLAFGHDEEIGGRAGAVKISRLLEERGIRAEYVLDEGLIITQGIVPGVDSPVATIGIAEKGYLTVELSVKTEGGHSSMPPTSTGIGILSRAVIRLEEKQRPAILKGPVRQMFEVLGPEMSFLQQMVFANLWFFGPLVKAQLAATPTTNAMIRTTTAVTMAAGSSKENILPVYASMVVNFRLFPGETNEMVLEYVQRTIDDPRIKIKVIGSPNEPSAISDTESPSYKSLKRTIREIFPNVIVAPSLVLGGTDSRHYSKLTDNIYRFIPYRFISDDLHRIHGTNERLGIENFVEVIRFYARLIENTAS